MQAGQATFRIRDAPHLRCDAWCPCARADRSFHRLLDRASGRASAGEPQKYQHRAIQTHDIFITEAPDLRPDLGSCEGCDFVDHATAMVCQSVSLIEGDGQSK